MNFDFLSPIVREDMEKRLESDNQKDIIIGVTALELMHASSMLKAEQITVEQLYDIVNCALDLIWVDSANEFGQALLEQKEIKECCITSLKLSIPVARKLLARLELLGNVWQTTQHRQQQ